MSSMLRNCHKVFSLENEVVFALPGVVHKLTCRMYAWRLWVSKFHVSRKAAKLELIREQSGTI